MALNQSSRDLDHSYRNSWFDSSHANHQLAISRGNVNMETTQAFANSKHPHRVSFRTEDLKPEPNYIVGQSSICFRIRSVYVYQRASHMICPMYRWVVHENNPFCQVYMSDIPSDRLREDAEGVTRSIFAPARNSRGRFVRPKLRMGKWTEWTMNGNRIWDNWEYELA